MPVSFRLVFLQVGFPAVLVQLPRGGVGPATPWLRATRGFGALAICFRRLCSFSLQGARESIQQAFALVKIADSFDSDEPLRATFLAATPVRLEMAQWTEVLSSPATFREDGWRP